MLFWFIVWKLHSCAREQSHNALFPTAISHYYTLLSKLFAHWATEAVVSNVFGGNLSRHNKITHCMPYIQFFCISFGLILIFLLLTLLIMILGVRAPLIFDTKVALKNKVEYRRRTLVARGACDVTRHFCMKRIIYFQMFPFKWRAT